MEAKILGTALSPTFKHQDVCIYQYAVLEMGRYTVPELLLFPNFMQALTNTL
jgi:hypothetical protein